MATSEALRVRIEQFARQLCEELGEADDSDADSWLDAVETQAVEIGDAVAAELVKKQAAGRSVDDEAACPQCGQTGRFQGPRQRELITRRGPVAIAEPEYYCPCCRKSFFPSHGVDRR